MDDRDLLILKYLNEFKNVTKTANALFVSQRRPDILSCLKGKGLPLTSIEVLEEKARFLSGKPNKLELSDKICGVVEYRDGTIIDTVHEL